MGRLEQKSKNIYFVDHDVTWISLGVICIAIYCTHVDCKCLREPFNKQQKKPLKIT